MGTACQIIASGFRIVLSYSGGIAYTKCVDVPYYMSGCRVGCVRSSPSYGYLSRRTLGADRLACMLLEQAAHACVVLDHR